MIYSFFDEIYKRNYNFEFGLNYVDIGCSYNIGVQYYMKYNRYTIINKQIRWYQDGSLTNAAKNYIEKHLQLLTFV
jgi:hypothetical protein